MNGCLLTIVNPTQEGHYQRGFFTPDRCSCDETSSSKYDSLVDEVELSECSPKYALAGLPDGKENTVPLRHLAPTDGKQLPCSNQRDPKETSDPPNSNVSVTDYCTGDNVDALQAIKTKIFNHPPLSLSAPESSDPSTDERDKISTTGSQEKRDLSTCKQEVGQNLDQFVQKLKRLAKDCGFQAVNASEYHGETIRDVFIRGMLSSIVRQRLMEEDDIDLAEAFTQARALETAESQSLSYTHPHLPCALDSPVSIVPSDSGKPDSNLAATIPKCFFCGYNERSRSECPARGALRRNCNKVGHFQRLFDNVTICGQNMTEHNINYGKILNAAKDKTTIAARTITLPGFQISQGVIKPDPERLRALRELLPPPDLKSQQRTVGMFAYYSNWISQFSDKIHNLIHNKIFPLPDRVKQTFEDLKRKLENAAVVTSNYQTPLVVETDASDTAIAATLNQDCRPVAFFSRTLNPSGPVLLKKQQRASKYDPVVEEFELLDCNPQYAHVRLPNGKEETVSVKHLVPRGEPDDLGTSECLADANDLIKATAITHEMYSNDEAADSPTPTNYELLKQKQQRLHPYNLRSREA
ncbi:uncharacterized protein DEA37_0003167 [Paragonimus westermani]|uniref:Reverse transcriptase/retrotransposon-derived protein RNase H-like domain-containing protein n=1 Tax=Paragonimus westermani TaxID=34504 RepID=A0A5J4NKR5_9TREM|nr:uncharacterized protein DEA37_0003167 [Paragonimus westermani]